MLPSTIASTDYQLAGSRSGRAAAPQTGSVDVVIDVPSGRVTARVHREDARVIAVDFVNVPAGW